MKDVVVSRTAAAPLEVVWGLATDLAAAPDHLSGVEKVEVLTPGGFDVGARWRETRTMFGRAATEEMWVTAVEPVRSYTIEAESNGVHYVSTFLFEPADGGTRITLTFGGRATGTGTRILGALTGPLARRGIEKALRGDLDDLAGAAEARGASSRGA